MAATLSGWARNARPCVDKGPPSIWVNRSPFPFQAGSERTFDELFHGPWKTRLDVEVYTRPRGQRLAGKLKAGTTVSALLGESIVVRPFRFTARKDFKAVKNAGKGKIGLATVQRGDSFWVLNSQGEGEFTIWWRCSVVGWDSTEPSDVDEDRLRLLGSNEERWVKVKDNATGLSGWFKDVPDRNGPRLVPAHSTTKATGD